MSFQSVCDSCGAPSAPSIGICPYCKSVMVSSNAAKSPLNESTSVLREIYDSGEIEDALALTMRMLPDPELQKDVEFLVLATKIMIESEAPIGKMNATINQAFRLQPRHPVVLEYLAILDAKSRVESGLQEQAEKKLLEILKASPKNPHANFMLGGIYFWERNSPEHAIGSLEMCVRERPQFLRAWGCLGALYRSLGRNDLAAAAFRKCLDIEKDHSMRDYFAAELKSVS